MLELLLLEVTLKFTEVLLVLWWRKILPFNNKVQEQDLHFLIVIYNLYFICFPASPFQNMNVMIIVMQKRMTISKDLASLYTLII